MSPSCLSFPYIKNGKTLNPQYRAKRYSGFKVHSRPPEGERHSRSVNYASIGLRQSSEPEVPALTWSQVILR
ncbi:Uncharacterised protein [Vibrio cholerae]|nr:Uncharacterised protein [Vibrio cholerae]CSA25929.1 Uncharacterised protein [Vibrio cholerae]CSA90951.1 Uncharacterised protein [Vibrio cholerae]CSC12744.1 Uncharacterised protein [Vibrio cholerae]CSC13415.1 Uncharacterised protein [Vibrio cholerae]